MPSPRNVVTTTTNPLVLVVLTWALLWGFGATQVPGPSAQRPSEDAATAGEDPVWEESWSRRFPGCVALALWPQDERPVAVVTRSADGQVSRIALDDPLPRTDSLVGACR